MAPTPPLQTPAEAMASLEQQRAENLARRYGVRVNSDAEVKMMSDAQARADAVYIELGRRAPPPLEGETPVAFQRRLLEPLKQHSKDLAAINLHTCPADVLAAFEPRIIADAMVEARNPTNIPEGELREIIKTDKSGRRVKEYRGSFDAGMGMFKLPVMIAKFHKSITGE